MQQPQVTPLHSRRSSSSKSSLTLDLSNLPPLSQPKPPSNTLIFTNLSDLDIFRAENLLTIRELIAATAPIYHWTPLRSFRRIVVSFADDAAAIRVRAVWDGEAIMGERCRVYFGQPTDIESKQDAHLALPDAGKLFFISPPPSPPHGWEQKLEDAPNKQVHAEDLADALAKLHHHRPAVAAEPSPTSPVEGRGSPVSGSAVSGSRVRSRSSTLIYMPDEKKGDSPNLPAIAVEDMTDEPEEMLEFSPIAPPAEPSATARPIFAHTARPPVELMMEQ